MVNVECDFCTAPIVRATKFRCVQGGMIAKDGGPLPDLMSETTILCETCWMRMAAYRGEEIERARAERG